MYTTTTYTSPARKLLCAVAAFLLTVVFKGEINQASVPAAQHPVLLQA